MQLFEKYRPRSFDDLIGQDKIKQRLELIHSRTGLAGRAYWIAGQSGTGKSTVARIIELGLATTDEHGFFRASEIIEPPARQR